MTYRYLGRNRWLAEKPDELYSDDVDKNGNVLIDARKYPEQYKGADDNAGTRKDRKSFCGYHRIVISDKQPRA